MKRQIRRAALAALYLSLLVIDAIGRPLSKILRRGPLRARRFEPGVSVIIPERANPALLHECLNAVARARSHVAEPVEVIVVVNGSPAGLYEKLMLSHPSVRWVFFEKPLWFGGAVRKGLQRAQYDWVYLLNNDMVVDPHALSELLKWRAPHIFAVASQIYMKDPARRREETGWTMFRSTGGVPEIFDAPPEDEFVRGTFYAGGGASLFQTDLLKRWAARADVYQPFYWEDVEWGTLAWRAGFESLFCPNSKVWHAHRATNRLFFSEEEISRVFRRNGVRFELRNRTIGSFSWPQLFELFDRLDGRSFRELMMPSRLARTLWARLRHWTDPFREVPLQYTWRKYYVKPWAAVAGKPTILMAVPYVIYPPAHGGAVRLHNLIAAVSHRFNVVLLSDEADAYSKAGLKYFEPLLSVHLAGGRADDTGSGRVERIRSHSHAVIKAQLRMLAACYRPALVQIEFMELGRLIEVREDSVPWLLTVHESWIASKAKGASYEDRYESALMQSFDAVITCCDEDAQHVDHARVYVVPNGAAVRAGSYVPSPESGPVLFIGPSRYLPNLYGIREFLERVYARLLRRIPGLRLWIMGGSDAPQIASRMPCFAKAGVTVMDYVEQPRAVLDQCALTINPLRGVRGSCLKVAESLAAGRVCVSTAEGARGFLTPCASSLLAVNTIEEFEAPIERLLCDVAYRRSIERPSPDTLKALSWDHAGRKMTAIYSQFTQGKERRQGAPRRR